MNSISDALPNLRVAFAMMGMGLLASMVLVVYGLRRLARIRREMVALHDQHERLFSGVQLRVLAQREQAQAEKLDGAERAAGLRRAAELYRQALAAGVPDAEAAAFIAANADELDARAEALEAGRAEE